MQVKHSLSFDDAYSFVESLEGGVSDNLADPGGLTFHGLSQTLYNTVASRKGWPIVPVTEVPAELRKQIAKEEFWDAGKCDLMPSGWALVMYDTIYNSGLSNAVFIAQAILSYYSVYTQPGGKPGRIDGVLGPVTIDAMTKLSALKMLDARIGAWAVSKSRVPFINGWVNNRAVLLRARVMELISV